MKGVSHVLVGTAAVMLVHDRVPLADSLTGLVPVALATILGSLLPDVDSDESTLRQATGTARSQGVVGRIVSLIVRVFGGHRGALTHSLFAWGLVVTLAGVYFRGNMTWVAFSLGYLSHLAADALTVDGVPLLWPLVHRRIRLLPALLAIRTGGAREYLVTVAIGVAVVLVYWVW